MVDITDKFPREETYPRTVVSQLVTETNELTAYVIELLNVVTQDTDKILAEIKETTAKLDQATEELATVREETMDSIDSALSDMNDIYLGFQQDSQRIKDDLSAVDASVQEIKADTQAMMERSDVLDTKLTNLETQTTDLTGTINSVDLKIRSLQNDTQFMEEKVTTLQSQLNSMTLEVQQNTADLSAMAAILSAMKSDVEVVKTAVEANTIIVDELNAKVLELSTMAVNALDVATTAHDLAVVVDGRLQEAETSLADMLIRIDASEASLLGFEARIASIEDSISSSVALVNQLSLDIDTAKASLSGAITTLNSEITALSARITPLDSAVTTLEERIGTLEANYTTLSTSINNQLIEANQAITDALAAEALLSSQLADVQAQYNLYASQAAQAMDDMNTLEVTIATYTSDIATKHQAALDEYVRLSLEANELTGQVMTYHTQTLAIKNEVVTIQTDIHAKSDHVDSQVAYVDQRVLEIDSLYLRKTEKAADTTLFDGFGASYYTHDGNIEAKLDATTVITSMKADITAINELLQSNDVNLDSLQEIVNFIKQNKEDLANLTISNIAGLQEALDGKLAIDGTAVAASKWATARTITFTGDVTGSGVLDGSGDVSITLTVADDSHAHSDYVPKTTTVNGKALSGNITLTSDDVNAFNKDQDVALAPGKAVELSTPTGAATQYRFVESVAADGKRTLGVTNVTSGESLASPVMSIDPVTGIIHFPFNILLGAGAGVEPFSSINKVRWASGLLDIPETASRWPKWSELTEKPTTFTPSAHQHDWLEITGKPSSFTPSAHTHLWGEISDKPSTFTPSAHNHYNLISQGTLNQYTGTTVPTYTGISMANMGTGYPDTNGNTLFLAGAGFTQLTFSWSASSVPKVRVRGKQDAAAAWSSWGEILTSVSGTAVAAAKWATARTLSLTGAAEGSVSWDGSANASLNVTIDGTKHTHSQYLSSATRVTAGDGLMGGGDLTTSRLLAVDGTVVRTSGNQAIAGVKTFTDSVKIGATGPTLSFNSSNGCLEFTFA